MTPYDWSDEDDDGRTVEGDWRVMAALLVAFCALVGLILAVL